MNDYTLSDDRLPQRFCDKAQERDCGYSSACWIWIAAKMPNGYGRFQYQGKGYLAHRFSYMLLVGAIPEGLQIDHLCRNRGCVNPAHLEAVTCQTNLLRGIGITAINAAKTHCPKGHPYEGDNLVVRDGSRKSRSCENNIEGSSKPNRGICKERTHCPQGHEYTHENIYWYKGCRQCNECRLRRSLGRRKS